MRCFLAVPIIGELADGLLDAGERIRNADPTWVGQKWVPRPNLHVTLHFLGDVPAGEVDALCGALDLVLDGGFDIELTATGLKAAPSASRARMLWGMFDDRGGRCATLARELLHALTQFEVERSDKPFRAHATLVRARRSQPLHCDLGDVTRHSGLYGMSVSDPSVTLFMSELTPRGPVYSAVRSWAANGHAG